MFLRKLAHTDFGPQLREVNRHNGAELMQGNIELENTYPERMDQIFY